jgi:hypothetical protein
MMPEEHHDATTSHANVGRSYGTRVPLRGLAERAWRESDSPRFEEVRPLNQGNCIVYFDTNVYDHIYKGIGVTADDVALLRGRIQEGRVLLRPGILNFEETLAAVSTAPGIAFPELRLIVELAGISPIMKPYDEFMRETVEAFATGGPAPSPLLNLSPELQASLRELIQDSPEMRADQIALAAEVSGLVSQFRAGMKMSTAEVREVAKRIPKADWPTFEKYWDDLSAPFAEAMAGRPGQLEACLRRGIDALLQVRAVGVTIGANLSLIYAYTFEGREPKQGDSRDLLHAISASAACTFVSVDPKFVRILKRIPVNDLRVMSLTDFISSLR